MWKYNWTCDILWLEVWKCDWTRVIWNGQNVLTQANQDEMRNQDHSKGLIEKQQGHGRADVKRAQGLNNHLASQHHVHL